MKDFAASIAKLLIKSRKPSVSRVSADVAARPLIILANGPSLRTTIADHGDLLRRAETMAVNFAANTPEFVRLRPARYILADPHFFTSGKDPNVDRLWGELAAATWPLVLYVPVHQVAAARTRLGAETSVAVEGFNAVGIEGPDWLRSAAYDRGLGMPRPRNVLIPAIMTAILAGFRRIYITGADHSWMQTISVDDQNHVVSIQPHFYADTDSEKKRVGSEYTGYKLHDIILSFYIAFRSYHEIAAYAAKRGVEIINATPGSFIDAFPRGPLPDLQQ